ncbi:hypothetical protein ACOME3_005858 [Neoechinorhynchus agilis]
MTNAPNPFGTNGHVSGSVPPDDFHPQNPDNNYIEQEQRSLEQPDDDTINSLAQQIHSKFNEVNQLLYTLQKSVPQAYSNPRQGPERIRRQIQVIKGLLKEITADAVLVQNAAAATNDGGAL